MTEPVAIIIVSIATSVITARIHLAVVRKNLAREIFRIMIEMVEK